MEIGRNDPCPCGSGKKYKKCCLEKDKLTSALPKPAFETIGSSESADAPIENYWEEAECSEEAEVQKPANTTDEPPRPPLRTYPRPDENLPKLPPEQEKIIADWWKITMPLFRKRQVEPMLRRVETGLVELPNLFVHLALHQEYIFELGSELGRFGRMPDYIALLQRLRREQPKMYSFCYGAYDSDIIAELAVTGKVDEIPAYFDFFRQYPDAQPDYCHQTCDLLAWCGLSDPLYSLCEAVATPMMTSSQVIGGNFAIDWLIRREEIPFYDTGDVSPDAAERTANVIKQLGLKIGCPLTPDAGWLCSSLKAYLEPPEAGHRGPLNRQVIHRIAHQFSSYLRRTGKIPWVQVFFLKDLLLDYFDFCRERNLYPFRFQRKEVETFIMQRTRRYFHIDGVLSLAIMQTLVWFGEYLRAAGVASADEVNGIKQDCEKMFELGRKAVDSTDPAYRLCPTFKQLTTFHSR